MFMLTMLYARYVPPILALAALLWRHYLFHALTFVDLS